MCLLMLLLTASAVVDLCMCLDDFGNFFLRGPKANALQWRTQPIFTDDMTTSFLPKSQAKHILRD